MRSARLSAVLACFVLSHAELLCWRNSVPQRSRSAWSNARCLLQSSAEVPQCSWRVASRSPTRWEVLATLDSHSDALCGVAWSPNQQRILTASADGTVGLWEEQNSSYSLVQNHEPDAWQLVAVLGSRSQSPVRDATWSPDSQLILAGSLDGSARVWRSAGNASRILRNTTAAMLEDSDSDNDSAEDNFTRLRPPAVQGRLLEPWSVHSMLQQSDTALVVDWSSNESALGRVLAGSPLRTACMSSRGTGFEACASSSEEKQRSLGASYLLGLDHSASIWHASAEMPSRWALEATLEGVAHLMVSVRWSPDGRELLTGGSDGLARIWTLTDRDFQGSGRQRWNLRTKKQVHSEAVRAVAWSPDGQYVLTSGRKGYAYIWHPVDGDWVPKGFLTEANGMKLPPNLTNTALRSPVNPARLDTLHPDSNMGWIHDWSPIHVARWSPDGQRIVTGSPDGSARIWLNNPTVYGGWTLEATLHGHSHQIWSLAWSPDSLQLVSGDQALDSLRRKQTPTQNSGARDRWQSELLPKKPYSCCNASKAGITMHGQKPMSDLSLRISLQMKSSNSLGPIGENAYSTTCVELFALVQLRATERSESDAAREARRERRALAARAREQVTSPEQEETSGEDDSPSLALVVVRAARPLLRSVQWLANRVLGEKKTNLGDTSQFSYDHISGQWVLQRPPGVKETFTVGLGFFDPSRSQPCSDVFLCVQTLAKPCGILLSLPECHMAPFLRTFAEKLLHPGNPARRTQHPRKTRPGGCLRSLRTATALRSDVHSVQICAS
ncbi:unnamed protein product [Symbiodinium natans]|uniref:Uncharacterized protein n=1 Tax=Symbiodinium natans TaxID=878477 RepID=A0A812TJC3_9DINO|nr:unnamed protein product [Symbiodinium natans]